MGTAQVTFVGVLCGGATVSRVTETALTGCHGSVFCACATRSCAIPPTGVFSPEVTLVTWPEEALTGEWPEVCSAHARFPPRFFLTIAVVQVPWLPEVTESQVTPSVFPFVCACVIWNVLGVFSRMSASIIVYRN
jgi:hypothetical protein